MQKVTLFSSGLGVFDRTVEVNEETPVKVSVKKEFLDEVLSSLTVLGDVDVIEPPQYLSSPDDTTLNLQNGKVFENLADALIGQTVTVSVKTQDGPFKGTLLGTQVAKVLLNGGIVEKTQIILMVADSLMSIDSANIHKIDLGAESKEFITKAANREAQSIRADVSTISLKLKGKKKTPATIRFSIPVAAWKMRYTLYRSNKEWNLIGQAVVDNNTDEDWKDASVTVVVGEPLNFSTDLAEVKVPSRTRYDLVSDEANGAVVAACSMESFGMLDTHGGPAGARKATMMKGMAPSNSITPSVRIANAIESNIKQVGEAFFYTCEKPYSITAKQSSIIPLFTKEVANLENVIYVKSNPQLAAYRALIFKNNLDMPLAQGVCTLFESNGYLGKCIINQTQLNEPVSLIYSAENGVIAKKNIQGDKTTIVGVHKNGNTIKVASVVTRRTNYTIISKLNEKVSLRLEHGCTGEIEVNIKECQQTKTSTGVLFQFDMGAKESKEFSTVEILSKDFQEYHGDDAMHAIYSCVISDDLLKDNPKLQRLIKIKDEIADFNENNTRAETKRTSIIAEQKRVVEILKGQVGLGAEQNRNLLSKVSQCEDDLDKQSKLINDYREQISKLEKELVQVFNELTLNWKRD